MVKSILGIHTKMVSIFHNLKTLTSKFQIIFNSFLSLYCHISKPNLFALILNWIGLIWIGLIWDILDVIYYTPNRLLPMNMPKDSANICIVVLIWLKSTMKTFRASLNRLTYPLIIVFGLGQQTVKM